MRFYETRSNGKKIAIDLDSITSVEDQGPTSEVRVANWVIPIETSYSEMMALLLERKGEDEPEHDPI